MADTTKVKTWLQHRINYWEDVLQEHREKKLPDYEDIVEGRAMLAAFYMVLEVINDERK